MDSHLPVYAVVLIAVLPVGAAALFTFLQGIAERAARAREGQLGRDNRNREAQALRDHQSAAALQERESRVRELLLSKGMEIARARMDAMQPPYDTDLILEAEKSFEALQSVFEGKKVPILELERVLTLVEKAKIGSPIDDPRAHFIDVPKRVANRLMGEARHRAHITAMRGEADLYREKSLVEESERRFAALGKRVEELRAEIEAAEYHDLVGDAEESGQGEQDPNQESES